MKSKDTNINFPKHQHIFLIAALFNRNRRVKTPDSVDTMITSFQAIIPLRIDSIQCENRASLVAQMVKRLPAMRETRVQSLGWEDPLEKEMATHSSILAWKISWMEPGRLQSMGSQRVRHQLTDFTSLHFKRKQWQILFFRLQNHCGLWLQPWN